METQWVQGFLTLSLSSLGGLLFFLFPNLKREAEARGCAMSAEKVKKKKRKSVRLWISLDLLLFVVEPCLIILGGIFIMLGLLKFRFGMHLFQDIFSTLWFRHRVQKGRIKVSCFTCESQLQGVYRHPSSGHNSIQLFSVWQLGLRSSTFIELMQWAMSVLKSHRSENEGRYRASYLKRLWPNLSTICLLFALPLLSSTQQVAGDSLHVLLKFGQNPSSEF